jgi:hypothetical protein
MEKNGDARLDWCGGKKEGGTTIEKTDAVKEIEEALQAADKLIQDHAKETGTTFIGRDDPTIDIQGWGTAERLIDKEQVEAWKKDAVAGFYEQEAKTPDKRPPPTSIPSNGVRPDTRTKWQKFWDWIGL